MNDHVIGALHESGIDGEERPDSLGGEAAGEERGVFLRDADIEITIRQFVFENFQFGSTRHGGGDGNDFRVLLGEVGDSAAKDVRAGRRGGRVRGAVSDLIGAEAMEFARIIERRLVSAAFLGDDVEDDGLVQGFEVLERAD